MVKKDYKVGFEDIILRRAKKDDNMEEIAKLLYETDPYIYPFWFNDDINEAVKVLVRKMQKQVLSIITRIAMLHMTLKRIKLLVLFVQ